MEREEEGSSSNRPELAVFLLALRHMLIEEPKKIASRTATFLFKVKVHRGESANEGANILADKAVSDLKVGKDWCQRTNRAAFKWKKLCREAGKVTYQDRHSILREFEMQYEEGQLRMRCKNMNRSLQGLGDK